MMAHCERGDEYIVGKTPTPTATKAVGAQCWAASSPSRWRKTRKARNGAGRHRRGHQALGRHFARTRLLALENTWNGHPMSPAYLAQATGLARKQGLATHLDGARVFNAAVAQAQAMTTLFAAVAPHRRL
jgi:threonine aldolase